MSTIQKVTYQDLINKDIDKSRIVDRAFGTEGLGILLVENYPSYELRENLLRKSREFAILPKEVKAKYEDAKSSYSFGWSCGVESMKNGVVDSAKGSYYANPEHDKSTDDTELKEKYPVVY
jgi:isopenicillin N synthase-like dioxygenase